jgi:dTMP kinase
MFLSVEGVDGSGKSTVVDAITDEFDDTVVTSEPSDLWTGQQVRRCLDDESTNSVSDFFLFMADRMNHIESRIEPAISDGKTVISDRYADSTRAYQPVALTRDDRFDTMSQAKLFIERVMEPWNYVPDTTIYLDISVETALERCDEQEKYEKKEFLHDVRANYRELIENEPDRFVIIDGEQSVDAVADEVTEKVEMRNSYKR